MENLTWWQIILLLLVYCLIMAFGIWCILHNFTKKAWRKAWSITIGIYYIIIAIKLLLFLLFKVSL